MIQNKRLEHVCVHKNNYNMFLFIKIIVSTIDFFLLIKIFIIYSRLYINKFREYYINKNKNLEQIMEELPKGKHGSTLLSYPMIPLWSYPLILSPYNCIKK